MNLFQCLPEYCPNVRSMLFILLCCGAGVTVAQDRTQEPPGSDISVSGEVVVTESDYFLLDVDSEYISVEMDDWDWYQEGNRIKKGDHVTVHGKVDSRFYQNKSIEADSVYVEELNTYFYASDADEEHWSPPGSGRSVLLSSVELTGTITDVRGRQFTLDTDERRITVDTMDMSYNPLDKFGYQRLQVGDKVRVFGKLNRTLFEKRVLTAQKVVSLVGNG